MIKAEVVDMKRLIALAMILAAVGVWAGSERLVLLDGKTMVAKSQVSLERNMLVFKDALGQKMHVSQRMIDWEATWRVSPELAARFVPEKAEVFQAKRVIAEADRGRRERKDIVITNETLGSLKPNQGMANHWEGRPAPEVSPRAKAKPSKSRARGGRAIIKTISKGKRVDLDKHLDDERYVIFDFYADWCGPCRQIEPRLKALVKKYPANVALKKIDIVNWNSAVSRQHGVNSIPRTMVYSPKGKKVLDGHGSKAIEYINRLARKKDW